MARQHGRGKMDARARLAALCDEGSFREIGKIAGSAKYDANGDLQSVTPAPFLFGKALINGRPVVATADDFTIRGGAADAGIGRKMEQAEKMAHELRLPIIRMIDGTGGGGSVKTLEQIGATYIPAVPGWGDVVTNLDTVPVVALAVGRIPGAADAVAAARQRRARIEAARVPFAVNFLLDFPVPLRDAELAGLKQKLGEGRLDFTGLDTSQMLALPVWTTPVFTWHAAIGVALPLFITGVIAHVYGIATIIASVAPHVTTSSRSTSTGRSSRSLS